MTDIQKSHEHLDDSDIDKQVNLMDQFIESGGFDQAFKDVFGLPSGVVLALGEVS